MKVSLADLVVNSLTKGGGTQPQCGQPSILTQVFCGKLHVAPYIIEFDRLWGVLNSDVDDLPSLLRYLAISRT